MERKGEENVASAAHHEGDHGMAHVMPVKTLFNVFFFLVAMTILTVWSAGMIHGTLGVAINMGIATLKALAVVLFFMHLLYDKPLNVLVFFFCFAFFFLFLIFTVIDSLQYHPQVLELELINPMRPTVGS